MTAPKPVPKLRPGDVERLSRRIRIDPATGCHNWTGSTVQGGYGLLGLSGYGRLKVRTHRMAYVLAKGPIPDGLVIDHLCRNPRCCNPEHLEAVTPRENTLRGEGLAAKCARATHCAKGHPYDEVNTYRHPQLGRMCRICMRARASVQRLKAGRTPRVFKARSP